MKTLFGSIKILFLYHKKNHLGLENDALGLLEIFNQINDIQIFNDDFYTIDKYKNHHFNILICNGAIGIDYSEIFVNIKKLNITFEKKYLFTMFECIKWPQYAIQKTFLFFDKIFTTSLFCSKYQNYKSQFVHTKLTNKNINQNSIKSQILNSSKIYKDNDKQILFYFIGKYHSRKNVLQLIEVFNKTFTKIDNVKLIIKTNLPCRYNNEIIQTITEHLSIGELYNLHFQGDIYLSLARGEGLGLPTLEAANFFDNYIITPTFSCEPQYFTNKNKLYLLDNIVDYTEQCTKKYWDKTHWNPNEWKDSYEFDKKFEQKWAYFNTNHTSQQLRFFYDNIKNNINLTKNINNIFKFISPVIDDNKTKKDLTNLVYAKF